MRGGGQGALPFVRRGTRPRQVQKKPRRPQVLIDLRHRREGRAIAHRTDQPALWSIKMRQNPIAHLRRVLQPNRRARDAVERQIHPPHEQVIDQIRPRRIVLIVPEPDVIQPSMTQHPIEPRHRAEEIAPVARGRIRIEQAFHRHRRLRGVLMRIDARQPLRQARGTVERKIPRRLHALHQIRILAGIEPAIGRAQERIQIIRNRNNGLTITRVAELDIRPAVHPQIIGLHRHDFFKMRMLPIVVGRILIRAAKCRVDQLQRGIQICSGTRGGGGIALRGQRHVPAHLALGQKFLRQQQAAELGIVHRRMLRA